MTARRETVRDHLCKALNQLLPPTKTATPQPVKADSPAIAIDANTLAKQVKESADNPARLRLNFIDKTFQVSGKVVSITESDQSYIVAFESNQSAGSTTTDKGQRMTVLCLMAKQQDAVVAALQTNQPATLVGRFQAFDRQGNAIKLQDCTKPSSRQQPPA